MRNIIASLAFVLLGCQPAFAGIFPAMGVDAYLRGPPNPVYSASSPNFGPYSTPTDLCSIQGTSNSKVIRVLHVRVFATQSTGGVNGFFVVKRSNNGNLSTWNVIPSVPHDSTYPAAGADVLQLTAAPTTVGTLVGIMRGSDVFTAAPAGLATSYFDFDFGPTSGAAPITLRNGEYLSLNFAGVAVPSGLRMSCEFNWSEN